MKATEGDGGRTDSKVRHASSRAAIGVGQMGAWERGVGKLHLKFLREICVL